MKTPKRFGVCLDTAHLFAAGYDFRGRKYAKFRKELDKTVGLSRVKVLHLNDSKKDLGSRVDRHEHIGRGLIGVEGFKPCVRDEAFRDVPKILETEKGDGREGAGLGRGEPGGASLAPVNRVTDGRNVARFRSQFSAGLGILSRSSGGAGLPPAGDARAHT